MLVGVKSVVDVITNSSTEVYVYYPDNAAERVLDLIQSILDFSGSDKKAVDLFDVKMEPGFQAEDDYEEAVEKGEVDKEKYPNTEDGIAAWIKDTDYDPGENWYGIEYPTWSGVKISPKADDPKLKEITSKVKSILNMCDYEGFRDG